MIIAILKIIVIIMIIIMSGSSWVLGESVRARLEKKGEVEGGRPARGGWGGRSPPQFANGSGTSRNTKT